MNTIKTAMLMALLMAIMVAMGGAFGGQSGATIMLIIAVAMNFFTYWFSDKMVLSAYGAREIGPQDAPELYHMVEDLAKRAELPMPKLCIINSNEPNAFATGRNPDHAAVAVTTGIMRALNYNELSGVIAHELSHVKHRDILISSIAATFATMISWAAQMAQWAAIFGSRSDDDDNGGLIGTLATIIIAPFAAMLIQMAISRSREYAADKSGGEICGNPNYLADALEKIEYYTMNSRPMEQATPATSHLFIINPLKNSGRTLMNLFSTHPLTEDRIARLREQAAERR
ncbi:MAG: zinc metalloprotease HtpX [Selenomonadaceae bacterium]|nr:zinc metalloprotease HtpX [Selenomonadaceae bacterium]MBQ1510052.1 zinc metalloprotease HtpX [Selenomonadaceae bacterium]MBQ3971091.1 zinc metalloprotease HtpX [Selenomonadaceae bacterium]